MSDRETILALEKEKRAAEFQYNMFPRWACHKRAESYPHIQSYPRHCNSVSL